MRYMHRKLTNVPIKVSLPHELYKLAPELKEKIKGILHRFSGWPKHIIEWHTRNIRISESNTKNIGEILNNVNMPWKPENKCRCKDIFSRLKNDNNGWIPKKTNGHIFFIGREYEGDYKEILNMCSKNIPNNSSKNRWNILNKCIEEIKIPIPDKVKKNILYQLNNSKCVGKYNTNNATEKDWPTYTEVYSLRKNLEGMVIGPLDKNLGESWFCCPKLYGQALEKMYNKETGDTEVGPKKVTSQQIKKRGKDNIHKYVLNEENVEKPAKTQLGDMKDVTKAYKEFYKYRGLNKYGKFNLKGNFNVPYILFKAKNVTDPEIRKNKLMKTRPIAPATKHHMKDLLSKIGRALYFLVTEIKIDSFEIPKVNEITKFLDDGYKKFNGENIEINTYDIEGCFPHMPKHAIDLAMRYLINTAKGKDKSGVWVPAADKKTCKWKQPKMYRGTWIPFEVIQIMIEFVLEHTYLKMPNGKIYKQKIGIPMGDPLSPGLTIGTCAWMEKEWKITLDNETKDRFKAGRYMDDIIMMTGGQGDWKKEEFLEDFMKSDCYWKPLKLEKGKDNIFLETKFKVATNGEIHYKIKNDNENEIKIWRYHDYNSNISYSLKRSILLATLRKVHKMANTPHQLLLSGTCKLNEFALLNYPVGIRKYMCAIMAKETSTLMWRTIRNLQQ